jgi:serine/threonine-protein kinase
MDALRASLADRYRIERELGAGGMATVYLAEDLKHKRMVALKVLKPELAAVLGAERFVQEITTTASLQHPHILPLFDSGTADGFLYYVMPFIQGETVRDKLNRETQLGVDEAVRIAVEVADALQYAHEQGVIHRDIKPENILLANGRPMVADFGIALAVSAAAGGRMTETGLSLGTPHYMSPEQATAEKEITGRSDIYSVASVLYEMLAGVPPHEGGSAQQTIMRIITDVPRPVTELRKSVPPNVAAAIAKALEKLPADRFATAHEFAGALNNASFQVGVGGRAAASSSAAAATGTRRTAVLVAAALAVGFLGHALLTRNRASPGLVARVSIPLDSGVSFTGPQVNAGRPIRTQLALSPDGRTLVFSARGPDARTRLFARALDAVSATPIEGTEGGEAPVFSPRGDQVAFWSNGRLRRVPVGGGTPVDVADSDPPNGMSWGDDDYIVFSDPDRAGLDRVRATGGEGVESLPSHPDAILPHVLPGSRAVLYTVSDGTSAGPRRVEALTLANSRIDTIVNNASDTRYVSGHLLFARVGTLMAVSFDPARLKVGGSAAGVLPDVMHAMHGWNTGSWTNAAQYAVSAAGHLAYLPGGVTPSQQNEVVWLNRKGEVTATLDPGSSPLMVRISPTGDRLAVAAPGTGATGGAFTLDLRRQNAVRRVVAGDIPGLLWSPDGRELVFRVQGRSILRVPADASAEPASVSGENWWPTDFTPEGGELIGIDQAGNINRIVARDIASGEQRVLVEEPAHLWWSTLSPDSRWLAYALSDGSEVVVRSWPTLDHRTVVAGPNASAPAWSRGGRELFYQQLQPDASGELVPTLAVQSFNPNTGQTVGNPMRIPLPRNYRSMGPVRSYDVTTDGERIAAILFGADVRPLPRRIDLVLNWASTLERPEN